MPWVSGGSGGGGLVFIADSLLTGSVASFDFTAIPSYFAALRIVAYLRSDRATSPDQALLRFNGDSGNNYLQEHLDIGGTGAVNGTGPAAASGVVCLYTAGANAGAGEFSTGEVVIPNYAVVANKKYGHIIGGDVRTGPGAEWFSDAFMWSNTAAAINRVTLTPNAGANWVAGSRVTLYGMAAG